MTRRFTRHAPDARDPLAYSLDGVQAHGPALLWEHASDMLSVHALDAGFTYLCVSPAAQRLFGHAADDLVGQSAFAFIHPDDAAAVAALGILLREQLDTVSAMYRLRSHEGTYTWVESTYRIVPNPDTGEPAQVIAITRSAETHIAAEGERTRLLEEAELARSAAEAASRIKDQFLAMMSHELRTPLNAIAGYVDLIQLAIHGPVTNAQHRALDRIAYSQRYLLRLVNDLLNVERLRSGRLEYDLKPVRVSLLVRELAPMIEPQLGAKSLSYAVDVADGDLVLADGEKLAQVLINLISNAVKFTPEGGGVTIDCPRRADGTGDELCFIRVRDTGVGIPDAKQSVIFDPFVQVDVSRVRRAQGVGLGLAISRDLSRGMGGELRVRSLEGVGSSFTVSLPRVVSPEGAPGGSPWSAARHSD